MNASLFFLQNACLRCAWLLFFGYTGFLHAQKYTLSGTVKDMATNETLIGVTIAVPELQTGVVTNEYGFYSITLPEGTHTLQIGFLGFRTQEVSVALLEDTTKDFFMIEESTSLDVVVIEDDVERLRIKKPEMSVNKLSINTIKKLPVLFGEVDVVKSLLLLPGVTNAGEGSSGFNVRGGAADQNLILLDEATVFNSSHLFGFFSVFNPDAIKDLKLYKGGIPARYGGRVASVLDIYQKDGNSKEFHGNGGIGAISSRLLLEGPLKKDKSSFLIGGRSSYAHLFLRLTDNENSAFFYDLNTKLSFSLNEKNNLYLSGYFGRDVFSLSDSFVNTYGNTVFNARWNHIFSDKLFSNLSLIYSDYFYGLKLDFLGFDWNSGIQNFNLKYDFNYFASNAFRINYGVNSTYYTFNPGTIEPSPDSGINEEQLIKKFAVENAAYIDVEHKISNALTLQYGLRYSSFLRLGQEELNIYEDSPVLFDRDVGIYAEAEPIGVELDTRGKIIEDFGMLEPRFSMALAFNENTSVKASYNRISQYLHLLSNTSSPTPLDVWTPSGPFVKPQILDQVAIGFFKDIQNNTLNIQTEVFYKEVQNRINYIDGANLIANNAIEQVILNGEARAYGLEFLLTKKKGNFTGWLGYTLSRSEERIPGRTPEEPGINNGEWFASNYDKTHDITLTTTYELSKKWTASASFLYQTGQPTTFPNGQYVYKGIVVPSFDFRNTNRLPEYHRLDLSFTYVPKPDKSRGWRGEWNFGVYNAYNRRNAASISFRQNSSSNQNEAVRLAIFGIVPSISYNFKF